MATFAYDDQEMSITEKTQYGGVGIVASSAFKHRIIGSGKDPSGLGHWVWIRIQGKEGHMMRITSAYRLCQSEGAGTVFQQHQRVLSAQDDHRNPVDVFLQDLSEAIVKWTEEGDHLVLGMDANEDVHTGAIGMSMLTMGLCEAILV
jgi:hypothetical protein